MSNSRIAALVVGVAVLAGVIIFAVSGGADDGRKASIGQDVTQVSISDVTVTEGTSASTPTLATFRITRSGDTSGTTQLSYVTANESALSVSDYNAVQGRPSLGPGETFKDVAVSIKADTVGEADEVFTLQFVDKEVTGALVADGVGKATIVNDDPALSVFDARVPEGNSGTQQVAAKITRTGLTTGTAQVQWHTGTDGGATDPSDFVRASGSVTFNPGQTEKTALITVNGDTTYEPDERIRVRLFSASEASIVDASGDVTIVNDDQPAQITTRVSINDVSVAEGNSASKMATFRITRSGDTTGTTQLIYYTSDGSALSSSSDYTGANSPLDFNEGVTHRDVSIPIRGDTVGEADERFTVRLDKISEGASIADGLGQATIVNDDPALSVLDARVNEGNTGAQQVSVKIARTGPTTGTAQAHWSTLDDTAKAGDDYVAASGTVTFNLDETEKTVLITIKGDVWDEGDEKFFIRLSSPSGADILPASTYVTIINDDENGNPPPR